MSHITALLIATASLISISTAAEAADAPQDKPDYEYGRDYGTPVVHGPQAQIDIGRDDVRYHPPHPAFKTWNNCPPNYTVQDGLCKPYRGR
jgi:hypothetical protein